MKWLCVVVPQESVFNLMGSGVVSAARMRRRGADGVVGPGLSCSPGAGGGEGVEARDGGHAGEVQGVAGGVEVAVEDCGVFAAQGESDGSELESAWGWRDWVALFVTRVGGWRGSDGLESDVAGD